MSEENSASGDDPADPTPRWSELPNAPEPGTALCPLAELRDGEARMHSVFAAADVQLQHPFRILLLRSGDQVQAYVNRCAHFGVPLAQRQEQLLYTPHTSVLCNVHYARYRWHDGVCDRGDCQGASLPPIPLLQDSAGMLRIAP